MVGFGVEGFIRCRVADIWLAVAADYEVVRWRGFDLEIHDGKPSDISEVEAQLVHAFDAETGETLRHFWVFTLYAFDNWDQWVETIDRMIAAYGMELAYE
jgi:hypothetical protein